MRKLKLDELRRLSISEYKTTEKLPISVVLDNIRSGMNVGSFFRTCDAFKIEKIWICGISQAPPHKEILKTAIGASKTVAWEYFEKCEFAINKLKSTHRIVGIEQTSISSKLRSYQVNPKLKFALVFGNEVNGLSDSILKHLDEVIEIEQFGTKHSLNVSVCGGIVMNHFANAYLD